MERSTQTPVKVGGLPNVAGCSSKQCQFQPDAGPESSESNGGMNTVTLSSGLIFCDI